MKNENPLEKVIEAKVCAYAKSLGVMHYKFTSPGKRSVPDRIYVLRGGEVFWIEFKRWKEVPTSAQALEIAKLKNQGATVFVVDNVDTGKEVIDAMVRKGMSDPAFN